MADVDNPTTPTTTEKKPEASTFEADLTKYKVRKQDIWGSPI